MSEIRRLNSGPFLFTREEWDGLIARISELDAAHTAHLAEFSQTPGCGSQGPDMNSERAELERIEACFAQRSQLLRHLLMHGCIAPLPEDDGLATIGKPITLQVTLDDKVVEQEWLIAGHEGTDTHANPKRLAYSSPLLDGIYGRRVGAFNRRAELVAVRMPDPIPQVVAA